MKYCSKCGNELFDEAVICPKCGCPVPKEKMFSKGVQVGNTIKDITNTIKDSKAVKGVRKLVGIALVAFFGFFLVITSITFAASVVTESFSLSIVAYLLLAIAFIIIGISLIKGSNIDRKNILKSKKAVTVIGMLVVAVVLIFTTNLFSKNPVNIEDALKDKVSNDVAIECKFSYANVINVRTNITSISENNGIYTVKGKVTITDSYGDNYTGKIDGEYEYYETSEIFHKISLEIEKPTRSR